MEELRTYFEQKCLQMEKQYSEEVFSQRSKRISDNDSETEELTDDLYFGGAGDCLNVSNSRAATPSTIEESLRNKILDAENQARLETEYESSIQALQKELELKVNEIQNVKADYKKTLEQQKELYECQIRDIEAKLEHALIVPTVHQVRNNCSFIVTVILICQQQFLSLMCAEDSCMKLYTHGVIRMHYHYYISHLNAVFMIFCDQ